MGGVPRSAGCALCIKRRVKCDETRPTCSKCQIYGESCPGYAKDLKFVEWPHRKERHGKKATQEGDGKRSSLLPSPGHATVGTVRNAEPSSSMILGRSIRALTASPDPHRMQYLSIFITDVSKGQASIPEAGIRRPWLSFLPERLGKSFALDQAIQCLAINHIGNMYGNNAMVIHGRSAYGRALSSLQRAFNDPVKAFSSDTLCAAMMLCMYELFASTASDAWMKHADGVGRLLKLRGPNWQWSEFDKAMMGSFKAVLEEIMEALFSLKYCFLDTPSWYKATYMPSDPGMTSPFYDAAQDFTRYLAKCPGLVKEAYSLASATETQRSDLVARTLKVYSSFNDWFDGFSKIASPPIAVLSAMKDPLYPVVYEYTDSATATVFCGYYASIIMMQEVLKLCQYHVSYTEETKLLADNICKSMEYFYKTGTMGPYRIGFSLRIAFEVADLRTKVWIVGWLQRIQRFYKVMSVDNYPAIEAENA